MIEQLSKTIPKSASKRLMVLLLATGLMVVLHLLGVLLGLGLEAGTVLRFPPALFAIAVIWSVSGFHQGRSQTGWRLLGLAALLWFLGDVLYGISEVLLRLDISAAPWLSLLYFAATFTMISGVAFLGYFPRNPSERLALLLETLIVVVGTGTFLWMAFLGQLVATKPFGEIWVDVISPVVGIGLVGFMFSYLLSQRQALQTSFLLTLGTVCIAILIEGADIIRSVSVYFTGHPIDVFASLAYVLLAAAAISSLLPSPTQTTERQWARLVSLLPYVVFAAAFLSFVWFFLSEAHETTPREVEFGMIIGIGLLATLTGGRTVLANRVNSLLTNELIESDERLRLALRGSNDGIWDWKLSDNTIRQSPRLNALLGYPEEESISRIEDWTERTHPEDRERTAEATWGVVKNPETSFSLELRYRCADGTYRWFLLRGAAVRHNGRTVRMAGSLSDLSQRFGLYDSLTGLANRALFREYIERALGRNQRYNDAFAVMFLDLNDFKLVNDSLGHLVGDALLVQVAKRLETTVRQGDILARLGGDEFAVLAEMRPKSEPHPHAPNSLLVLAERLIERLEQPYQMADKQITISASIGIVDSSHGFATVDEFLSAADTAMYHAKGTRSRVAFFDQTMSQRINERLELENALRHAVRHNTLELYFQAIHTANSLEVLGFEALLRWTYNGNAIAPDIFVPLAEQSGLIFEVGSWALERACRVAAGWQNKTVSVNVSSRQFDQEGFVNIVQRALQHSGLAAERLVLEITESALLERAEANLVALRALGVRVQIDDFGTGYSNLSYLHRFPVSALKIDKRFVAGIEQNETRSVVQAIIAMARSLGLQVIAEGVETQAQLEWLRGLNCDAVQGYLFAKPVPAEALLESKS
jgi:diguanylate cyclase (GGDEF)-like protein/PAS domain S-box-containing protein